MLRDATTLLAEFASDAEQCSLTGWPCEIRHECLPAPHRQVGLPPGYGAVYVFSLSAAYGATLPAGADRVLKAGMAGPKSDARFRSQHYGLSAPSTLARSLLGQRVLWRWLGITDLTEATVKAWMLANLDRDHFYVPAASAELIGDLEVYIRGRVGSVFEGVAKDRRAPDAVDESGRQLGDSVQGAG